MTTKGFTSMLQDLPRKKDCCGIILTQKNTLRKYEETNEMLRQFLELSEATHKVLLEKFTAHSKTLYQLKKDLENCFKRIRTLKTKLQVKHPDAFEATADAIKELQEKYSLEDKERPPSYYGEHTKPHTEGTLSNNSDDKVDNTSVDERDASTVTTSNDETCKGAVEDVETGVNVENVENIKVIDSSEIIEESEISRNKERVENIDLVNKSDMEENAENIGIIETIENRKTVENAETVGHVETVLKPETDRMGNTRTVET